MWTSDFLSHGNKITRNSSPNTYNRISPATGDTTDTLQKPRFEKDGKELLLSETPKGYLLYSRHLRLVGLIVDGLAINISRISPKRWIPMLLLLSCVISKQVLSLTSKLNRSPDEPGINQTNNQSSNEVPQFQVPRFSWFLVAAFMFPSLNITYEIAIWIIFFRKRSEFTNISKELHQLAHCIENDHTIGAKVVKRGRKYLCLLTLWYLCECALYYFLQILPLHGILQWDKLLLEGFLTSVILLHKVISSVAVEGLFIFYLGYFKDCLENFNETLKKLGGEQVRDTSCTLYKRIEHHRLLFGRLHILFGKVKNVLSTALAYNLMVNISSIMCFVLVYNKLGEYSNIVVGNNESYFQIIVNIWRICIICWYSGIISDEVSDSLQIISNFKLNEEFSHSWKTNHEILLFSSQITSSSFLFTAAGFCEIRKPLLPTLVGVLITYTVLLLQNN